MPTTLRSTAIEWLAQGVSTLQLDRLLLHLQERRMTPFIRAVNYHDVPRSHAAGFEQQVRHYLTRFVPVGLAELDALMAGNWEHDRPGILLSFDDGLRSHHDVVAPILEKYGIPGWFMVPVGFVDSPLEQQAEFADRQWIQYHAADYEGPQVALSWDNLRKMAKSHVIGCHTWNHKRLAQSLTAADLDTEIAQARSRLEDELAEQVRVFTWVGGEDWSYSASAAAEIRRTGFQYSFMGESLPITAKSNPLQLHRTNVEASYSMERLRTSLSGIVDLRYAAKRRRVDRLTS